VKHFALSEPFLPLGKRVNNIVLTMSWGKRQRGWGAHCDRLLYLSLPLQHSCASSTDSPAVFPSEMFTDMYNHSVLRSVDGG
jgi:hypothetical protein